MFEKMEEKKIFFLNPKPFKIRDLGPVSPPPPSILWFIKFGENFQKNSKISPIYTNKSWSKSLMVLLESP